jgi:dihydroorotase-like cyclic amidohydrolase
MRTLISGGTLLTPHKALRDNTLIIEQGKIAELATGRVTPLPGDQEIDA